MDAPLWCTPSAASQIIGLRSSFLGKKKTASKVMRFWVMGAYRRRRCAWERGGCE